MLIALLVLVGLVGGVRFLFLLTSSHYKSTSPIDMKTKALDVCVYVGIGISLVVSITNLLQVIFAAINQKFPDILSYSSYVDASQSDVRFGVASLVVMFPIYVGLSWYVAKDIKKFLYKQDIAIRKIMIYLTLFVTTLTLIGTLVSVIYTYLGGELSVRFELKALAVFLVTLSVFGYYFYTLRRNYAKSSVLPVFITLLASACVVGAVIWSISIMGTPTQMRAKKIDSTRLSDISRIQQEVFNRVQSTDKLPLTLTELNNAFQGYKVPVDPVTLTAYGYKVIQQPVVKMNYTTNRKELTSSAIFELCATFDTARAIDARGQVIGSKGDVVSGPVGSGNVIATDSFYSAQNYYYEGDQSPFWNHDKGETCFKRIISPDMYYGR
jgi:hypothetical protein